MSYYKETCSFLHAHYTETKEVEKFVKTLFYGERHSLFKWTYVLGAHWGNSTYATEMKEKRFEIYIKQVSCPLVFLF